MDYQNLENVFQKLEQNEQTKRLRFLEKAAKFDFGINIVLGIVVLFLSSLIFLQSFNIISFSKKDKDEQKTPKTVVSKTLPTPEVKVASAKKETPVYISEVGVDIEKVFKTPANNLHLTINGQLKKEVFGFLPYWMIPKIDDIDLRLMTTISYFGLEVDGDGRIIKEDVSGSTTNPWFTFQTDPKFNNFLKKAKQNRTKVLATLKCFNQTNIVNLVTSDKARENFISDALYLVNSKSLDGINVDFEYIGTPEKAVTDGFSVLISDLNKELKRQYPKAILSVDTFVDAASFTRIHDIPVLANNSDALVIMGYDFHTPNSSRAGPVAPLEGYDLSVFGLMSSYLEKAPAEKLILAVPYYGYDWPVVKPEVNGEVVIGRANVRVTPYAQIMDETVNTQIFWDDNAKTPWYTYKDSLTTQPRVVHFENTRSLGIKYDYINDKKLQGVGIWALGFDGKRLDLLQLLADKFAN